MRIYGKEINMIVAKAMKEELEKYKGIEVYMTREEIRICLWRNGGICKV